MCIRDRADGQQCDVRILQAVLFSMYSMPPSCNCSCFAFTTEQEILQGRNSDFLTEIERIKQNVVYKLTDGVYSFTGNTTAFIEIEDGVNEHGLSLIHILQRLLAKEAFGKKTIRSVKTSDAKLFLIKLQQEDGKSYSSIPVSYTHLQIPVSIRF